MAQEIYHRSEWGNPTEQWGNVYLNADLTNELYKRASEYENSWVTDQLLNGVGTKPSIILTPTAYEDGVLNSVKPAKTFGSELIPNGTFKENVNGWVTNNNNASFVWQIDQTALFTSTSFAYAKLNPTLNLTSGTYKVSFDILSFTGTLSNVHIGLGTSGNTVATTGSFSYNYVSSGGSTEFQIRPNSGGTGSIKIDNISVKKITEADFDFTRGSSATRVNEQGLVEDVTETNLPRINYTDGEGSLLLEPQSTNLITYSEDFSNATWSKSNVTMLSNQVISPDGTLNAFKTYPNSSGNYRNFRINTFNPASGLYTFSIFAKAAELEHIVLIDYDGSGSGIDFNLSTGVATDNSTSGFDSFDMVNYGNGWYRCIATSTNGYYYWILSDNGGVEVTANGTDGVYVFGGQVEALSYATSYISTNGSTVTRLADVCNNSGSSDLINSTEGVLYAEISALANDGNYKAIALSDGTLNNQVLLALGNTDNKITWEIRSSGITSVFTSYSANVLEFNKIAIKYKANDFALWLNGSEVMVDTSGNAPIGLNVLDFERGDGALDFYGNVKCVAVFKEALSDTELQKLTTI